MKGYSDGELSRVVVIAQYPILVTHRARYSRKAYIFTQGCINAQNISYKCLLAYEFFTKAENVCYDWFNSSSSYRTKIYVW